MIEQVMDWKEVGEILIADYFLLRRMQLNPPDHARTMNSRHPATLLFLSWLCVGCSPQSEPIAEPREPSFNQQVLAVQQGLSREIRSNESITDDQFAQLRGLVALEVLSLQNAELSDKIGETLQSLVGLRQLRLEKSPIGELSARAIGSLAKLNTINLPHSKISDHAIESWPGLSELILLRVGSPNMTDAALETIGKMQALRFLHLIEIPISDVGLTHLHKMGQLESFYLDGGLASDGGLSELIRALPELHFHRDQLHLPSDPKADDHGRR